MDTIIYRYLLKFIESENKSEKVDIKSEKLNIIINSY